MKFLEQEKLICGDKVSEKLLPLVEGEANWRLWSITRKLSKEMAKFYVVV